MPRHIDKLTRRLSIPHDPQSGARLLLDTEWLVTNGLGGYASGTMAGVLTRRYHGLLVAALANPLGRTVMLNHLGARVVCGDGTGVPLGAEHAAARLDPELVKRTADVRLEAGLPVWEYMVDGMRIERRVLMPHRQNTVHVSYTLIDGPDVVKIELEPAVHFRGYEERVDSPRNSPSAARYTMSASGGVHVLSLEGDVPPLRLHIVGGAHRFVAEERFSSEFLYPVEESRGYEFRGTLWVPGRFEVELKHASSVTLIASAEQEEVMLALTPEDVSYCEMDRRRRLVASALPAALARMKAGETTWAESSSWRPINSSSNPQVGSPMRRAPRRWAMRSER